MILGILFFTVSLFSFGHVLFFYLMLRHGQSAEALVSSVDHAIATGLRSFLTVAFRKKEHETLDISCDYILRVTFSDEAGENREASFSVPAVMKIKDGKRFRYFNEGDRINIRYWKWFPSAVCLDDPEISKRQKYPLKLVLWAVCVIFSAAILFYILTAK